MTCATRQRRWRWESPRGRADHSPPAPSGRLGNHHPWFSERGSYVLGAVEAEVTTLRVFGVTTHADPTERAMLAPGWFCPGSLPARKVASGPIHTPQTLRRIGCVGGCRRSLTGAQELGMQCGAGPEGSAPFAQRSRGNLIHVVAVPVRPGLPARDCGASCSSDDFGGGWLCSHDGNRTPCSVGQLSGGTSREKVIHCAVQPTTHHNHAGILGFCDPQDLDRGVTFDDDEPMSDP